MSNFYPLRSCEVFLFFLSVFFFLSPIYMLFFCLKNKIMCDVWNENDPCRCCQSEDGLRSLGETYNHEGTQEIYADMLRDCFNIIMQPPNISRSYNICERCICRLRDANIFKQQVIACERALEDYSNQVTVGKLNTEIKSEDDSCSNDSRQDLHETSYDSKDDQKLKYEDRVASVDVSLDPGDVDDQPLSSLRCQERDPEKLKDTKSTDPKKAKKFACQICQKKFSYNGFLEVHMRTHTGEKTVQCRLCNNKYTNNKELNRHISTNHSYGGRFPCPQCSETFDKARLLKKHLTTHFEDKFSCSYCEKEFQRKKGLKEHLKTHTGEKKYSCNICGKSFGHNQTLKSHILTHTGEKPYVCDVCGRRFPQRTHLKRHIFIIHTGVKPYSCNVCKKQFSSKSYLAIHERQHTGERPFSCEECNKTFTAYTTLKVHMRVHTGLKPYSCSFCSRQFAQMASFKLHERTHTGERPFACKICKKPFSDNGYLKIHMRVHTGEKPYNCDVCKRAFRETGQLKRHMRVHTGVKPYTCKICNKQIGNLSKHMRIHSDNRYNCNICNKQFSVSNLKLHMKIHSSDKPFACDLCSIQFTEGSGSKRHRCTHTEKAE